MLLIYPTVGAGTIEEVNLSSIDVFLIAKTQMLSKLSKLSEEYNVAAVFCSIPILLTMSADCHIDDQPGPMCAVCFVPQHRLLTHLDLQLTLVRL